MSDYDSNYGERDYLDYADSFAYRYELEAEEADAAALARRDRMRDRHDDELSNERTPC